MPILVLMWPREEQKGGGQANATQKKVIQFLRCCPPPHWALRVCGHWLSGGHQKSRCCHHHSPSLGYCGGWWLPDLAITRGAHLLRPISLRLSAGPAPRPPALHSTATSFSTLGRWKPDSTRRSVMASEKDEQVQITLGNTYNLSLCRTRKSSKNPYQPTLFLLHNAYFSLFLKKKCSKSIKVFQKEI